MLIFERGVEILIYTYIYIGESEREIRQSAAMNTTQKITQHTLHIYLDKQQK